MECRDTRSSFSGPVCFAWEYWDTRTSTLTRARAIFLNQAWHQIHHNCIRRQRQPSFGVSKSDIESFVKDSLVVTAVSLIQIFMLPRLDSQQKVTAEADRLSSSPRFGVMNASNNHCISSSLSVGVYNTDQSIKRFKSSFFPTFRSIEYFNNVWAKRRFRYTDV